MRRISSRWTFFYKRIFPLFWFGILLVSAVGALVGTRQARGGLSALMVVPVLMGIIGYALFRRLVLDLVDEVWDDGDSLLVKNGGVEERVELKNIVNIGFSSLTSPERVTLTLREPGRWGKEITFSPPRRFMPFARSPIVNELIERVDRARG